jgi:hypothetical protein
MKVTSLKLRMVLREDIHNGSGFSLEIASQAAADLPDALKGIAQGRPPPCPR